jgi:hypothetical protein
LLDQRRDDAFGVLVGNLDQHHVARMAFDKRCNIAISRPTDQIAFPMAGDWAWLDNGRLTLSFLDSGTPQMIVVRLIRAVSVVTRRRPQARTTKPIVHMRRGFGLPRLFQGRVANRSDS